MKRLTTITALASMAAMLGGIGAAGAAAVDPLNVYAPEELGAGEFALAAGEQKTVSYEKPRDVRVCVERSRDTVPLNVEAADTEQWVMPGECITVTAEAVTLTPSNELPAGGQLVLERDTAAS